MSFIDKLNEQIGHEFAASQQYVAIAVHYDGQTLPRLAATFYQQSVEERNHALMMVRYLMDADATVVIPGVSVPETQFGDIVAPVALALEQERRVSGQIAGLMGVARAEGDYLSEQFMQWFLKEQVEEMALMTSLMRVADRAGANLFDLENFVAREIDAQGSSAGAPAAAGGRLGG